MHIDSLHMLQPLAYIIIVITVIITIVNIIIIVSNVWLLLVLLLFLFCFIFVFYSTLVTCCFLNVLYKYIYIWLNTEME